MNKWKFASVCTFVAIPLVCLLSIPVQANPLATTDLCGILQNIEPGEQVSVKVAGIYRWSQDLFFTEENRECTLDLQSSTVLEFPEGVQSAYSREFEELVTFGNTDGLVRVTLTGTLHGPKIPGGDDTSVPVHVAYAHRGSQLGYGPQFRTRTKLVVEKIESVERFPDGDPGIRFHRPPLPPGAVKFLGGELPSYPPWARQIELEGKVVIQAHIKDGKVIETKVLSGDRLLYAGDHGALKNMETWRFDSETNQVITTAFVYRLEHRIPEERHRIAVDFNLPRQVTITGSASAW